jgi:hypothetical protein
MCSCRVGLHHVLSERLAEFLGTFRDSRLGPLLGVFRHVSHQHLVSRRRTSSRNYLHAPNRNASERSLVCARGFRLLVSAQLVVAAEVWANSFHLINAQTAEVL